MKHITWNVIPLSTPAVIRYCRKCGKKTPFRSSDHFRVNAQQKSLDIWLIYKCETCDATWNAEVYARISPQKLDNTLLERFHRNDAALAKHYALDMQFLRRNQVQPEEIPYVVEGSAFSPEEDVLLTIRCDHSLPIHLSKIIRSKLSLSQKDFLNRIASGTIYSTPQKDLKKCRLGEGIILRFEQKKPRPP